MTVGNPLGNPRQTHMGNPPGLPWIAKSQEPRGTNSGQDHLQVLSIHRIEANPMNAAASGPTTETKRGNGDGVASVWQIEFESGKGWNTRTQPMDAAIAEARQRCGEPDDAHGVARRMKSCEDVQAHIGDPTCDWCAEIRREEAEWERENPPQEEPSFDYDYANGYAR